MFCLGRGAHGIVYQVEHENIQYAMKISNRNSRKEYEIFETMKNYINEHRTDIRIIHMFDINGFILSRQVGKILNKNQLCQMRYITHVFMQLSIGHKLGLVHRDVRMYNLISFNDEYVYLIDWNSSTSNGYNGRYEGAFLTASMPVLVDYEASRGQQVSAYYADDCVSVIYMLLLSSCTRKEELELKECAYCSDAGRLIVHRRQILRRYPKEILDRLHHIEQNRAHLTDIDDLHHQCQQIIQVMFTHGLVS